MKYTPPPNCLSFIKGFWFVFHDEENTITAGGSAISGHEYVYFNDELISTIKSMKTTSKHKFKKNGIEYEITFHVPEISKSKMECVLHKNNRIIKRLCK